MPNLVPCEAADDNPRETYCKHDYKYRDAEKKRPDTFPFKNHTDFLFYTYLCSGAAPSLHQIDTLLLLIRDPLFNRDELSVTKAESFINAIDKKLPLMPLSEITCDHKVRVEKKQPKVLRTKDVQYIKPSEVVRTFMSTPGLRKHLTQGHDEVGDGPVHSFNQSPFHKQPLKWMYDQSFYHKGIEYAVGDSVELSDGGKRLLIESLEYRVRPGSDKVKFEEEDYGAWLPSLYVVGLLYSYDAMGGSMYLSCEAISAPASEVRQHIADIDTVCTQQVLRNGRCIPRKLGRPTFAFPGARGSEPFLWLAVYIDKFGSTRSGSTEGIYLMVCNVDPAVYASEETIFTLMLLSDGCDLTTALPGICLDLAMLSTTGVRCYDCSEDTDCILTVRAAVAMLPADSLQAYVSCRALGSTAKLTGRNCSLQMADVKNPAVDCRDHTRRRRRTQSDAAVTLMRTYGARHSYTHDKMNTLRRWFGVQLRPCIWADVKYLDPHMLSFWDASHLLWFGVFKNCLAVALATLKKKELKRTFVARIQQFKYPRGVSAPMRVLHTSLGPGVTMEGFRTVCMVLPYCGHGLFPNSVLKWFISFCRFAAACFSPLSKDGVVRLQTQARDLIRRGSRSQDGYVLIQGCKPNTHGMLEMVLHTLPAFRNGIFCDTRHFETHHSGPKADGGGNRGGRGGGHGEANSMRWSRRRDCLRTMFYGGTWFSVEGTHTLSPTLAGLRDYRPGLGHTAHPLVQLQTGRIKVVQSVVSLLWDHDGEEWLPSVSGAWAVSTKDDRKGVRAWQTWSHCVKGEPEIENRLSVARSERPHLCSHPNQIARSALLGPVQYSVAKAMHKDVGARRLWVHEGDAVEVELVPGVPAWCRVRRIFVVRHADGLHRMWIVPEWCTPLHNPSGDVYTHHPLRGTTLIRGLPLSEGNLSQPILASEVRVQVCLTHSCKRKAVYKKDVLPTVGLCVTRMYCAKHGLVFVEGCAQQCTSGDRTYMQDDHDEILNTKYEIVDRRSGMSGLSTRASS